MPPVNTLPRAPPSAAWRTTDMAALPLIWVCIIAAGVAIYVVLDGFDLGIDRKSTRLNSSHH